MSSGSIPKNKMDTLEKNEIKSKIEDNKLFDEISDEELSLDDEKEESSKEKPVSNKKIAPWKLKLLILANKPMSKLDSILEFFGGAFEPIFCGVIPLLIMSFVSYNIFKDRPEFSSGVMFPLPTIIVFGVMIPLLMFLPKLSSAIEFITLGIYIGVMKSGLLLRLDPVLCGKIDPFGYFTSGWKSGGILGMTALVLAVLLIVGKTVFFIYFKLKKYRRKYLKRKHGRKKEKRHIATLDSNSEVLM